MLPLLVLLFIAVPIIEIYAILQVGQAIGPLWTIALLVLDSILGAWLMRSQGRAVWRRFNATLSAGRPPTREVADGVLVIFGGALLLTPGFVTDIVGALFLLPPTRALIRRFLAARVGRRMVVATPFGTFRGAGGTRRPASEPYDADATAHDVPDSEPGRLRP
jgi:UPF0716 protein FxsA